MRDTNKRLMPYSIIKLRTIRHARLYAYYHNKMRYGNNRYLVRVTSNKYVGFRSYGAVLSFLRNLKKSVSKVTKSTLSLVLETISRLFTWIWSIIPEKYRDKLRQGWLWLSTQWVRLMTFMRENPLFQVFLILLNGYMLTSDIFMNAATQFYNEIGQAIKTHGQDISAILHHTWDSYLMYLKHTTLSIAKEYKVPTDSAKLAQYIEQASQSDAAHLIESAIPAAILYNINNAKDNITKTVSKFVSFLKGIIHDITSIGIVIVKTIVKLFIMLLQFIVYYVLPVVGWIIFVVHSSLLVMKAFSYRDFILKEFVTEDFYKELSNDGKKEIEDLVTKLAHEIAIKDPLDMTTAAELADLKFLNNINALSMATLAQIDEDITSQIRKIVEKINANIDRNAIKQKVAEKYTEYLHKNFFTQDGVQNIFNQIYNNMKEKIQDTEQLHRLQERLKKLYERYAKKYVLKDDSAVQKYLEQVKEYIISGIIVNIEYNPKSHISVKPIECDDIGGTIMEHDSNQHASSNIYDARTKYYTYKITKILKTLDNKINKYYTENQSIDTIEDIPSLAELDKSEIKEVDKIENEVIELMSQPTVIFNEKNPEVKKYQMTTLKQIIRKLSVVFSNNNLNIKIPNVTNFIPIKGDECHVIEYKISIDIRIPAFIGSLHK